MLQEPAAAGLPRVRRTVAGLLVGGLLWRGARAVAPVSAAQEAGLTPDWGGGALLVHGEGFRARERVTLVATVGTDQQRFTVDADGAGRFTLRTGMRVPAGSGIKLAARGDQGTEIAALTSGPGLPLGPTAAEPAGPGQPRRGPTVGLAGLAAAALAALGGLGWRAQARARRAR
jgi:hypothetical protein